MKAWRGVLAYPFSLAAIALFAGLLVFALWRLLDTEAALRTQAGDNMLWTIAQAQVAAQRLDTTLSQVRLGDADADALRLRYDVLLSRLTLLEAGPQRRYLEDIGHFEQIEAFAEQVYAQENAILSTVPADGQRLRDLLTELAAQLGRAANSAMVTQWDETGAHLDRQREAIIQAIALVAGILTLGTLISWRMLAALQAHQDAQRSLVREQEMREAYRSFVALVSHQFRTPLSVIDSSMQRILRMGEDMPPDEIADRARRVKSTVGRLTDLMQATLDSVKLDAGQIEVSPAECDLMAELETARTRQLDARPARTIRLDIGGDVPARLTTDPLLLQQIMGNLLANALAYSPQSEPVTIRARASNNRLHIAVADSGVGIPEEEKGMVFQPFFRASTATKLHGAGIGLHLSRRLAHMLGGDLTFKSEKGLGSTFTLELPL